MIRRYTLESIRKSKSEYPQVEAYEYVIRNSEDDVITGMRYGTRASVLLHCKEIVILANKRLSGKKQGEGLGYSI